MTLDVIQHTSQLWRTVPERAQGRLAASASSQGPSASVRAGSFSWRADLPPALGGGGSAPSPTEQLLGVTLRSVRATASCESDDRGLLGICGAVADLQNIVLSVEIDSPNPQEKIDRLLAVWKQRCPVYLALTRPQSVRVTCSRTV